MTWGTKDFRDVVNSMHTSTVRYGRVICDYIEVTAHPTSKSHECHCKLEWTFTAITPASEADDQMRRRFQQLLPNCPLSALYAISVFGSISCIYRHTPFSNGIEPPLIPSHPLFVTDIARHTICETPKSSWRCGWIVLVVVLRWVVYPIPNYDRPVMIWYRQFILRWWTVVLRFIALVLEFLKWLFRDPEVIPMTTCVQQ